MNQTEYITKEGERWDEIAYKAYGDVAMVNTLIEANRNLPVTPRLEAGTRLIIPIQETLTADQNTDLLPPWKR